MKYELYVSGIGYVGQVASIKEAKEITAAIAKQSGSPRTFVTAKL